MPLPVGFFMPLPLPIMIPFMMWQSAAIAAGFGTYFQYAKRRVSAMSNEEFNKFNPSIGVNQMFDDIMSNIPSSFERIRSLNVLILQSMSDFLTDGVKFLSDKLGGQLGSQFQFEGPPTSDLPNLEVPNIPGLTGPLIPQAFAEEPPFVPSHIPTDEFVGPPAPPLTQAQLLAKYANWKTYRQKGGLLTEQRWRLARRGQLGGIPNIPTPTPLPQGKIYHPAYFQQLKSLQNNRNTLQNQQISLESQIRNASIAIEKELVRRNNTNNSRTRQQIQFALDILVKRLRSKASQLSLLKQRIKVIQNEMNAFASKFKPNK